ncbi:hypothetical protein CRM22_010614 [Opisthorchis felineus]|uniref:Uncharacterized protein n=1 Tax=Opisthorchis felineus TaxID=147828 RepID=A0A4S2KRE7_OPIFE|nr:hypothetical protein CRM22_010614 [Opisthorchis felineus]
MTSAHCAKRFSFLMDVGKESKKHARKQSKQCLNNSAVTIAENIVNGTELWEDVSADSIADDFRAFLGIKYTDIEKLTRLNLDKWKPDGTPNGKIESYHSQAASTTSIGKIQKSSVWAGRYTGMYSSLLRCKRSGNVDDRKTETTKSKHFGVTKVIWDFQSEPIHPKMSFEALKACTEMKPDTHVPMVGSDWWAEVLVYAKLGYWSPDILPPSLQTSEASSDMELRSLTSTAAAVTRGTTASSQHIVNPAKRFIAKFGGLHRFYQCLYEGTVSTEDLETAIHLCHFGLHLGLKRSTKNMEDRKLQQRHSQQFTLRSSNIAAMYKVIQSQAKNENRNVVAPTDLRAVINTVFLGELNSFRDMSFYQNPHQAACFENATDPSILCNIPPVKYDESVGTVDTSTSERSTESTAENPPDATGLTQPSQLTSRGNGNSKLRHVDASTQLNSLSSLESRISTDLRGVSLEERQSQTTRSAQNFGVGPDKTERRSLHLNFTQTKSPLPNYSQSSIQALTAKTCCRLRLQSFNSSRIFPSHRTTNIIRQLRNIIPDLENKIDIKDLLEQTILHLGNKILYSPEISVTQGNSAEARVQKIVSFTSRKQPILGRILRQQSEELLSYLKKPTQSIEPRASFDQPSSACRFMLPTIKPGRPPTRVTIANTIEVEHSDLIQNKRRGSNLMRSPLSEDSRSDVSHLSVVRCTPNFKATSEDGSTSVDTAVDPSIHRLSESFYSGTTQASGHIKTPEFEIKDNESSQLERDRHLFLVPRLPPRPATMLQAVSHELCKNHPYILEYFTQTLQQVVADSIWVTERNPIKLFPALERLGADLMVYRQSSGHVVRFKIMSIISASERNRQLRKQLKHSAMLQGNWLDQLLRSLGSQQSSCRTEAALALAKLASETRLMNKLLAEQRSTVITDIFHSLFRAAEYYPKNWPEYYMTISFFLHHNQCQRILDSLLDCGAQAKSSITGSGFLHLLAYIYTYWPKTLLEGLSVNEKYLNRLLDSALSNPTTKKATRETIAAMYGYITIKTNLVSLWQPESNSMNQNTPNVDNGR